MLEKKKLTITLPKVSNNKYKKQINIINKSGKCIIVYQREDLNFLKISGIKNIFKMIWYNIIYFLKGEVKIKC